MATMTMVQAIRSAMDVMLERDNNVVVFGEDVGYFGGVFRCTEGLQAKYGTSRVFDTPISEGGIVGIAVGMGAYGLRPVAEIQFADYFYPASTSWCPKRHACGIALRATLRRRSSCAFLPAAVSMRANAYARVRGTFTHVSGLKTVVPSNPQDQKTVISAIEDDDPVSFLEPKRLYNGPFDGLTTNPSSPVQASAR